MNTDLDLNDIMNNQPTLNLGIIGSVADGKTSIVKALTLTDTKRHSSERKENKTINLGYANAKIFQCPKCPKPECFQSYPSDMYNPKCQLCCGDMVLRKHVSFVDVPGHNSLMAAMLNGTSVMDSTIIVEAINNKVIPAPQTEEHLFAAKIMNLHNMIVCMNKMDLITKQKAIKKIQEFQNYLVDNDTVAKNSFIIPMAANYGLNKDVLCEYITRLDDPKRDLTVETRMVIVRSFKNNKPDTKISEMNGGVVGGTIMEGVLRVGDKVEILPGLIKKNQLIDKARWSYRPIRSLVKSIQSENNNLQLCIPGGLVGVQLTLDPGLTTQDKLVGNILRVLIPDKEPVKYHIFEVLYVITELLRDGDEYKINNGDRLVVNHNARNVDCTAVIRDIVKKSKGKKTTEKTSKVSKTNANKVELTLDSPICAQIGEIITISKKQGHNIIIMCRGKIMEGESSDTSSL